MCHHARLCFCLFSWLVFCFACLFVFYVYGGWKREEKIQACGSIPNNGGQRHGVSLGQMERGDL